MSLSEWKLHMATLQELIYQTLFVSSYITCPISMLLFADTDVAMTTASPAPVKIPTHINDSKEFDPLSQKTDDSSQSKVMSAFGINNDGKWSRLLLSVYVGV